jgi:ATP-dependent DNA helicase DinG
VANHSLFFSDLVLHKKKGGFLPQYSAVIFDEAHSVETAACEHFGIDVSNFSIRYLLNSLYNPKTHRGFLTVIADNGLRRTVTDLHRYADAFFEEVGDWLDTRGPSNGRVEEAMGVTDLLSEPLKALAKSLREARTLAENDDDELELGSYSEKCIDMAYAVEGFLSRQGEDFVFWVERGGRRAVRITLNAAPVSIAPYMREFVYSEIESAVFTSATLSVATDDKFEYLRRRLGLDECATLKVGSPFDYYRQAKLVIPPRMPAPTEEGFTAAAARAVVKYVTATKGRAFVLFTSYTTLEAVYNLAAPELKAAGITCYRQGADMPRSSMLAKFRTGHPACIFGTDSFWQGVDVPGEALSNVIITRLPFPVPDRPLTAARMERIRDDGGDPFLEYSLPEAVLKFKQGFGRLIRTKTDTGIVVVLDRRIAEKWYGRAFLDSIPKCEIVQSVSPA